VFCFLLNSCLEWNFSVEQRTMRRKRVECVLSMQAQDATTILIASMTACCYFWPDAWRNCRQSGLVRWSWHKLSPREQAKIVTESPSQLWRRAKSPETLRAIFLVSETGHAV
jgi:hypothetical protein